MVLTLKGISKVRVVSFQHQLIADVIYICFFVTPIKSIWNACIQRQKSAKNELLSSTIGLVDGNKLHSNYGGNCFTAQTVLPKYSLKTLYTTIYLIGTDSKHNRIHI